MLLVRAVDKAGNIEAPYLRVELTDDLPNSRAAVTEVASPHQNLLGTIGHPGDEDWLGIRIEDDGRLQAQLVGMSQDHDLYLYDGSGRLVAAAE